MNYLHPPFRYTLGCILILNAIGIRGSFKTSGGVT
jgi:hypothetical protein